MYTTHQKILARIADWDLEFGGTGDPSLGLKSGFAQDDAGRLIDMGLTNRRGALGL